MVPGLTDFVVDLIPKLPALILGLLFGYIVIKIILYFFRKAFALIKTPKSVMDIFLSIASIVLWIIFFSEFARHIGLSGLAVTFSGILIAVGLAIANGATLLISDIISGLLLAKDQDFEAGYLVKFGDLQGIIKRIDIRKVRIEDKEGQIHVVSNSKFDSTGWTVLDKAPKK